VWRHAYRLHGSQLLEQADRLEKDNCRVLLEAYSPPSQALTVNRVTGPASAADAADNALREASLVEGLVSALQPWQEKWD
jgi:hypothetical protein